MGEKNYRYIYGPVPSWRLGSSLGIDPISQNKKICTFDCIYCQIGRGGFLSDERKTFVQTQDIINELNSLPSLEIDYITFSGRSEPTLAKNLGEIVREIKKIRKEKIAVISNSSLIDRKDAQEDLSLADLVMLKLDAPSKELFLKINQPVKGVELAKILKGIKEFRAIYKGRLALQIMFIDENKGFAKEISKLARDINPEEVQINTPLRPSSIKPLSKKEINTIKPYFEGMSVVSVYD